MAIKAVIFDCFGVLVASSEESLFDVFPQHSDKLNVLYREANIGLVDREGFLEAVRDITGMSKGEQVLHHYCNVDDRDVNESAIDWARQIKTSGKFKLGLLSNVGRGWLDNFLETNLVKGLFDAEILSGEVKTMKPEPKIFLLMAKKLNVKPSECIMVDDREENIEGAKIAGMRGIVFGSTKQARSELDKILGE